MLKLVKKHSKKLLFALPLIGGALIGLVLLPGKNRKTANKTIVSPEVNQAELTTNQSLDRGDLEKEILSSQALLAKAIELSKEKDTEQNEQIIELINEAIQTINQAIGQYPYEAKAWAQRGKIYQTIEFYMPESCQVAIASYQQAVKLDPNNSQYSKTLADIYLQKNQEEEALFYLQLAVEASPTDPNLLKQLASQQVKLGRFSEAKINYQRLLSLLINKDQRESVQKEINSLNQLIAQSSGSPVKTSITVPEEIILPDTPPLLEANNLAQGPIIAAPEEIEETTQEESLETNAFSGKGLILQGGIEVKIFNNNLSPETQVYLTTEENIENQILMVKKKVPANPETGEPAYFIAGIQKPLEKDVPFRWWIIKEEN